MKGSFSALLIVSFAALVFTSQKELKCDESNHWTVEQRRAIVDRHNKLRSNLIHGLEKNAKGQNMPRGKNMYKLKWSCELEKTAQKWAEQTNCNMNHSSVEDRQNAGENLFGLWKTCRSDAEIPKDIALIASDSWWSELRKSYNQTTTLFTLPMYSLGVGHFTQMAWGSTYAVGCGVERCEKSAMGTPANGTSFLVVCHYKTAGNWLDTKMYEIGEPCSNNSNCPGNDTCSVSDGLCQKNE